MIFCPFLSVLERKISHSTKPAPPPLGLAVGTGQYRPFPAPWYALPHPLQNRVPRGERAPVALCREPTEAAAETSPSAPAKKPAETLGFCRFSFFMCCMVIWCILVRTLGFLIWFDPFSTVPIPSSTQNAPGFAFFGPNRVRFSLFCCFLAAKFLLWFLCTLLHSVYKLKTSVMPCRREVSFLT